MARALSLLPLALLFLASAVPSHGQKAGASAGGGGGGAEREVSVRAGAPLVVECPLRPEQRVEWRRDGGPAPADLARGEAAAPGGGLTARLSALAARPHHAGLYTCARDPPRARLRVRLLPAPHAGPELATDAGPAPTTVEGAAGAGGLGSEAARAGEMPEVKGTLLEFEVRPSVFLINCSDLYRPGEKLEWSKNGSSLEEWADTRTRMAAEGGVLKLAGGARAAETDYGYYRCQGPAGARDFTLRALPVAKLNDDSSVVEGQKLKLTCRLTGLPYPPVVWTYSNSSDTVENGTDAVEAFGGRASLRDVDRGNGVLVRGGELVLEPAARADAGWLRCAPQGARLDRQAAITRLRVKDMYAALWPFLGICAEVFVLCAIILLYERRRTKPELDDSDTDNHDQVVEVKESLGPDAVWVPLQPPPEPPPPPLPTPDGAEPPPPASGKKS